ncbi:hypothetical protein BJV78DRAFT_1159232 [Lactifluus subvellereus]|nr:hypothetical protein BJV78DRAFT_1159232 [Lactifluus subvellereus]
MKQKRAPPPEGETEICPEDPGKNPDNSHTWAAKSSLSTKPTAASPAHQVCIPSASTSRPTIPKIPAYLPRWPRKDESMLSINGSPLANPYELGLEWPAEVPIREVHLLEFDPLLTSPGTLDKLEGILANLYELSLNGLQKVMPWKRMDLGGRCSDAPSICNRREPSFAMPRNTSGPQSPPSQAGRSRSNSQLHLHSNSNSRAGGSLRRTRGHMAARVAVPIREVHLLEFDPLLTSPGALTSSRGSQTAQRSKPRRICQNDHSKKSTLIPISDLHQPTVSSPSTPNEWRTSYHRLQTVATSASSGSITSVPVPAIFKYPTINTPVCHPYEQEHNASVRRCVTPTSAAASNAPTRRRVPPTSRHSKQRLRVPTRYPYKRRSEQYSCALTRHPYEQA